MLSLLLLPAALLADLPPDELEALTETHATPVVVAPKGLDSAKVPAFLDTLEVLGFDRKRAGASGTCAWSTWHACAKAPTFERFRKEVEALGGRLVSREGWRVTDARNTPGKWVQGQCACQPRCTPGKEAWSCRPHWTPWGIPSFRKALFDKRLVVAMEGIRLDLFHGHGDLHLDGADTAPVDLPVAWTCQEGKEVVDVRRILLDGGASEAEPLEVTITVSTSLPVQRIQKALSDWGIGDVLQVSKDGKGVVVRYRWGVTTPGGVLAAIRTTDKGASLTGLDVLEPSK